MASAMLRALEHVPLPERVEPASPQLQWQGMLIAVLMRKLLSRSSASRRFLMPSSVSLTHSDLFVLAMQAVHVCSEMEAQSPPNSKEVTRSEPTF